MKETSIASSVVRAVLISLAVGSVSGLLLLLLAAAVASSGSDPAKLTSPLAFVSLGLTALVCGIASARLYKDGDVPVQLVGAFTGSLFVVLLFIFSFLPLGCASNVSGGMRVLYYSAVVCLSMLGASIAKRKGRKRSRYPVKKRKVRR